MNKSVPAAGRIKRPGSRVILLLILALVLAAALLYWRTLRLPLLYDDLLHIRIAKGLDWLTVWLPNDAFGFFRPLAFAPFLAIKGLFGYYPPILLHGLNVAQHALNVFLIATLSWRLWRRLHWTIGTGLLLAFFPFSYQTIAIYANNVHPFGAGLLMLALHTYLFAIQSATRTYLWWTTTALLFVAGLLSNETAVLLGPYAAMMHWNLEGRLPQIDLRQPGRTLKNLARRPWFLFSIAGMLYLVGYQFLDFSRAPQPLYVATTLWSKFLYLGQAMAYPISWIGQFVAGNNPAVVTIILISLVIMLALTIWSARERSNRLPLLFGWGWSLLAYLLIGITLETDYLLHSPRLLYLGSVGLSFLWPVLLEPIYQLPRVGRPVWLGILAFTILTNGLFVQDRLAAYERLTAPVEVVKAEMADLPAEEGILLVNLPNWLDKPSNTYPVGVEFVPMLGGHLFVEELMAENLRVDRPVQAIKVPDLLTEQAYPYGIHVQAKDDVVEADWAPAGSRVFVTTFDERGPQTRYTGRLSPESYGQTSANFKSYRFGPYELVAAEAETCDQITRLTTTWHIDASTAPEGTNRLLTTSVFAQLLSGESDQQLVAQADAPLLGLRPDLLNVPSGWLITDVRELSAETDSSGELLVGVYDFSTGQRFLAAGPDGERLPDDALRIRPEQCP